MIKEWTVYDNVTGKIVKTLTMPESLCAANMQAGESCIEGHYLSTTHYINSQDEAAPRIDYTVDSLPLPCSIYIEGVEYPVTEQPVFEFDAPGVYVIGVDAGAAYLEKVFAIDYQT